MEQTSTPQPPVLESRPITLTVTYPEQSSRLLALCSILFMFPKMLLLIPHYFVLWLLGFIMVLVWIVSQFAVLFTGRYPRSFFDYIVSVLRWQIRVNGYLLGLTDQYPPFSLEE
ncbi:MAG: DUF4389 domain-containing protein [Candidatus Saccharibacteria bacterium]